MIKKVVHFYLDGFRNMREGKTLWLIIGIKLFVIFFVVKYFFFPPRMHFANKQEQANYHYKHLIR